MCNLDKVIEPLYMSPKSEIELRTCCSILQLCAELESLQHGYAKIGDFQESVCSFRQMLDLGVEVNSHPVCFLNAEVFWRLRKCEGR